MSDAMSRRTFVNAALGAAALAGTSTAFAGENTEVLEVGQTVPMITDDDDLLCERGGTTLTVQQLNRIRRERVEAANGFTREDGTEIKPIWHKLATLIDTYGWGGPDPDSGDPHGYVVALFNDDEEELLAAVADGGYDVLVGDTLLDGFIPQESACRHVEVPHVAVSSRISWDKPVPLFGEGFLAHVREALR